ncbi:MAG: hypothetical protein AAF085_06210 [Planctomycetota bacterium]
MTIKNKPLLVPQIPKRGFFVKADLQENPMWAADASGYRSSADLFSKLATILGSLGIIASLVLFFIAFTGPVLAGIIGAATLAFQSVMLIVFGSMMETQSKVLLALFEVKIEEIRNTNNQA